MPDELTIPSEVGQYCLNAAAVLESSRRFLDREIDEALKSPDPDDAEWCTIQHSDIELANENLAKAVEFLDWLAAHSGEAW